MGLIGYDRNYYDAVGRYYAAELKELELKASYQFGNPEIKAWLISRAYLRAQAKAHGRQEQGQEKEKGGAETA